MLLRRRGVEQPWLAWGGVPCELAEDLALPWPGSGTSLTEWYACSLSRVSFAAKDTLN